MKFPNALHSCFHFEKRNKGLLLENPISAFLYYSDRRVNLLTNELEVFKVSSFLEELFQIKLSESLNFYDVFHFYYEFGEFLELANERGNENPLAIHIRYNDFRWLEYDQKKIFSDPLSTLNEYKFEEYQDSFDQIMSNLIDGNCYQVNFTHLFRWEIPKNLKWINFLENFYSSKNISAYGHHTYFPNQEKLILSNSPECLFQVIEQKNSLQVHSMPIKGTIKGELYKHAKALLGSNKDKAELNMITDLVRNDLAKIEKANARVLNQYGLLKVPSLWHLFSRISVETSKKINLLQILKALFPGGSITGAPKKRVMKIINSLEREPRGIYCGSTFLSFKSLKTASINIRTADIDLAKRELTLGTGGGITLLSQADNEYQEMLHKQESFLKVLHLTTYQ